MVLKRFQAENFRNIERCDIEFSPGVNLLYGHNAQGKTNALEGIYYFARGKSFRASSDEEMVKIGQSGFETKITFDTADREMSLFYSYEKGKRKRQRNGVPIRLSEMLGQFRAVLFCPEHLQIVKAGPEKRREFINVAISQNDNIYISYYGEYGKLLDNRNYLLKTAQKGGYVDMQELYAWSEKMAESAAQIYIRRKRYLEGLSPFSSRIMKEISEEKETLTVTYEADISAETVEDAEKMYRKIFTENLKKECAAGYSLYGIQRDDLNIMIDGISARTYASQGQQRSIVLSLKLGEGAYSHSLTGEYPIFLFDDVFSELDEKRRDYILNGAKQKQMIITTCDKWDIYKEFWTIDVDGGTYAPTHR